MLRTCSQTKGMPICLEQSDRNRASTLLIRRYAYLAYDDERDHKLKCVAKRILLYTEIFTGCQYSQTGLRTIGSLRIKTDIPWSCVDSLLQNLYIARLKMCFKLFLLATIVVAYVAAAAKDRASDAFSLYPFNNYPYYVEPTPSNNNNADSHRQMLTMSFVIPAVNLPTRLTILETLTSTSTIVCTKSVSNQCSVRRRTQRPWRVNRPALAVANKK